MTTKAMKRKALAGAALALWIASGAVQAATIRIELDTSAVNGGLFYPLLDLFDGDAAMNNTVTAGAFTVDGASATAAGTPTHIGGATGDLTSSVTLTDTGFFNEFFQAVVFGDLFSFTVELTENFAGGTPDSFIFSLLDGTGLFTVPTTDPFGADAFVAIDLAPFSILTFDGLFNEAAIPVRVTEVVAVPVPEPGTLALLLAAGAGLLASVSRQKARQR